MTTHGYATARHVAGGGATYTRDGVILMLSLSREEAIERDARAGLADGDDSRPAGEGAALPLIARWNDVQRARAETIREKDGLAILQLRAYGMTEEDIAGLSGRHRLAVRRRWHATVDEILERLGSVPTPSCAREGRRALARAAHR